MFKNHVLGGMIILAGASLIYHLPSNVLDSQIQYPELVIAIFISIVVGFGIMLDFIRIKNV